MLLKRTFRGTPDPRLVLKSCLKKNHKCGEKKCNILKCVNWAVEQDEWNCIVGNVGSMFWWNKYWASIFIIFLKQCYRNALPDQWTALQYVVPTLPTMQCKIYQRDKMKSSYFFHISIRTAQNQ